jgi:CubicO group peptidase (beta-lactamase class C family)
MYFFLSLFALSCQLIFATELKQVNHDTIDSMVIKMKEASSTPAYAVNIVHGQQLYYQKAFGVRDVESMQEIDNETLFRIGSASKGITAMLIAKYKQDGLLNFEDKVSKHLSCFVLKDPQATANATIHDLLTHQLGLARHDVMWYNRNFNSYDLLKNLRFLDPSCSFREYFLYQNLGYCVLGLMVEQIRGCSFNEALINDLLEPLDMSSTHLLYEQMQNAPNFAKGHKYIDSEQVICTELNADCIAPAGAMISNNNDIAKYLAFLNSRASQLIDKEIFNTMISPKVVSNTLPDFLKSQIISDMQGRDVKILDFECYGYGWILINYRGIKLVFHAGNIEGHTAFICFLPDYNLGISVLSNQNMQIAPHILAISLIDEFLGLPKVDWLKYHNLLKKQAVDYYSTSDNQCDNESSTVRPLISYAGSYCHGAYGTIDIQKENEQLILTLRGARYKLIATQPDIFSLHSLENDTISIILDKLKCQFTTDIQGRIQALYIPFDPMAPPIKFEKMAPTISRLKKYTGKYYYKPYSTHFVVIEEKTGLHIKVMGYDFTLVKIGNNTFRVVGKENYKVTFERDSENNICSITLHRDQEENLVAVRV